MLGGLWENIVIQLWINIPVLDKCHVKSQQVSEGGDSEIAAAAKLLQSCPTLCNPVECGSPPGSPIPGILQARILEWIAISFSNAWKWKVKVKSLSRVRLLVTHGLQPTRLLYPWDFPGKSTGVGCHCLLRNPLLIHNNLKINICFFSFFCLLL